MDNKPSRQNRKRTRFDRSRQNLFTGIAVGLVAVIVLGVVVLITSAVNPRLIMNLTGGGPHHNEDIIPRNMDLWAVYPGDVLRFVTIFYPDDGLATLPPDEPVTVAGPLMIGEENLISAEPFGGEVQSVELMTGLGQDEHLKYQLYTLTRTPGSGPYGLDARITNAPYIQAVEDGYQIGFGIRPQNYYMQVIVAVAFPRGTRVGEMDALQPYRIARIGGWEVYYFDVTVAAMGSMIRIRYTLPEDSPAPADLDYWQVEAER
jgi:hypothetical protein